jgi:hypothetical protein
MVVFLQKKMTRYLAIASSSQVWEHMKREGAANATPMAKPFLSSPLSLQMTLAHGHRKE